MALRLASVWRSPRAINASATVSMATKGSLSKLGFMLLRADERGAVEHLGDVRLCRVVFDMVAGGSKRREMTGAATGNVRPR